MDSEIEFHLISLGFSEDSNVVSVECRRYCIKSANISTIVFPFGSSVLICSVITAGRSEGESSSFHLLRCQRFARVTKHNLRPFHLDQRITILEINPLEDTTEFATVIVIQCRGNSCGLRIQIVEVPVSYLLPFVTGSWVWRSAYHVTYWILKA